MKNHSESTRRTVGRGLGGTLLLSAAAALFWGCGEKPGEQHAEGPAGHHHASVHGGVAVELGEHQYQLDLFLDRTSGTLSAWIMDAHLEDFIRLPLRSFDLSIHSDDRTNTLSLTTVANEATGETLGDTAQFRGSAEWLKELSSFHGAVIDLEIRGTHFRDVTFAYPSKP